ncbi:tyramine oxidase (plasmid) [Acinetobacter sp. NCu2D-2]|uniref:primary-amine oxidase n=1 Tax=Acinetobacter sp. NCu2D-2 TaxID=1608473 RepID=UPI0007CDFDD5|nr:primary-amine oxidase [Acinetobacter sp. NCu2D-2]ANF83201.1 tyramine oxidase [Acinetobacter sp. NCu2D-2]
MKHNQITQSLKKLAGLNFFAAAAIMGFSQQVLAHGQAAEMVPLYQNMSDFGAEVKKDDFTNTYTISKGSVVVRAKPNSDTVLVNGKPLKVSVPLVEKNGKVEVSKEFAAEIFQSGLDQTFKVEATAHPLNGLNTQEITKTYEAISQSEHAYSNMRFSEIKLRDPAKEKVWDAFINHKALNEDRIAEFTLLKGKSVIEGAVNLKTGKVIQWNVLENTHGMVLYDDMMAVQDIVTKDKNYIKALAKRGVKDPSKIVTTPLTVGYFGGKDGLSQELNVLKVVSYVNVGDGNHWAHPIENLVAVVDLDSKKVIKIEEGSIIPVPMTPRPIDTKSAFEHKPLNIVEPEGKNFSITGQTVHWGPWCFHVGLDSRVGVKLSTVTYKDKGVKRKVMYEGNLGGMVVPYGDPDIGWYFKSYLDSGEYGMGTLTSPIEKGIDAPDNAVLLDAVLADYTGQPRIIPNAIAIFERYAGPEYKHQEMDQANVSAERRELVVRWISTVGNYDYMFDWVFNSNGIVAINAGATGIEAVKGVKARTMHDATAKEDTRYGTLIDHNIVGTTHQHIYNFRLDMDIDGEENSFIEIDPVIAKNTRSGPRTSTMEVEERTVKTEQDAAQKFDPSTIRLLSNTNKENRMGNPVSYQIIPYAGGTHPIAKGANFSPDEWLFKRLNFMDKQIWVTKRDANELFPEGKYTNRSKEDTGLGQFVANNDNIENKDLVVWMTTGTTHVARAEEWPIMPTEWVYTMLKPWNYFDSTPTLQADELKQDKKSKSKK